MDDLRQDLRVVRKKCRPDCDIMTPEMKAARQQGRKVARKYLHKDKPAVLVVGNDCDSTSLSAALAL